MERQFQIGVAGFALVVAAVALAGQRPKAAADETPAYAKSDLVKLASISTTDRRSIDYRALDERLRRMAEKPTMVGMAVGIVEGGRITFLNGYGETVAGSGEKVTPQTVFRWASVSKGVAGTMAAKLAE